MRTRGWNVPYQNHPSVECELNSSEHNKNAERKMWNCAKPVAARVKLFSWLLIRPSICPSPLPIRMCSRRVRNVIILKAFYVHNNFYLPKCKLILILSIKLIFFCDESAIVKRLSDRRVKCMNMNKIKICERFFCRLERAGKLCKFSQISFSFCSAHRSQSVNFLFISRRMRFREDTQRRKKSDERKRGIKIKMTF